jgi:predicted unusual protein kinase regulating ubiquinone biosynthesis (AarF/ABC1/UbiB family)
VRAALEGLGPVFSAFGLYLSTRADLLPVQQCLELSAIPDRAAVTPADTVRDLVERELGTSLEETYPSFEAEPFESRLLFQAHRARLRSNQQVVVVVIHPEIMPGLETDAKLLDLVPESLGRGEWANVQLDDALVDFREALQRQTDLKYQAEALVSLGADIGTSDGLRAPLVHRDLCTSMVLTRQQLPGRTLSDLLPGLEESAEGGVPVPSEEVIQSLFLAWLRQVFEGRTFPVGPLPGNTAALPDGRIAFIGGLFTSLAGDAKTNLWNYMIAAAEQNPDRACAMLIQEMECGPQSSSENELRVRFRQIVPFRDGGWSRERSDDSLVEYLFLHWRAMRDHGYWPRPDLLGFFRGLFSIADLARRVAPHRDFLREGLVELRLRRSLTRLSQLAEPGQWNDLLLQNASMMMTLPNQLDQVLTRAAKGDSQPPGAASGTHRQRKNARTAMTALLFLVVTVALWAHYLTGLATVPQEWIDRGGAVLFVLLGALLLRAATRS